MSQKKAKPEHFINPPPYPGGQKAMDRFIHDNLRYPEEAIKNQVQGIVVVRFDINTSGIVEKAQILRGIGSGCDEEAVRVVKLLRFGKKKYPGMRVTFHRTVNIRFRLPEIAPAPEREIQIQYQYSEKESAPAPATVQERYIYTVIPAEE